MWPFRSKPEVELDNAVYARWLRAQRPPFEWFLGQPALIQEALATEGDRYVDECIMHGADMAETPVDDVEEAARIGAEMLTRAQNGQPKRADPPISFGGVGERREQADADRKLAADKVRSFLGRKPDGVEEAAG